MEIRSQQHAPITFTRAEPTEADNHVGTLSGYINMFSSDSLDLGGWVERILPGAFTRSLQTNDVVALINHQHSVVVGRLSAGTLELKEDDKGLAYSINLPGTQAGKDVAISCERGDLKGCSFGFNVNDQDMHWSTRDNGQEVCEVKNLDLVEVSIGVTFPAFEASTMQLRSHQRQKAKAKAEIEIVKRRLSN